MKPIQTHYIPADDVLGGLTALVGRDAAERFLASEPAPKRRRKAIHARFLHCVSCGFEREQRTPAPECSKCAGKRGGRPNRSHPRGKYQSPAVAPHTPEQLAAEKKFLDRWKADPAFRSIAGAAAAAQICTLGGHPPLDMLERVARAAEVR